MDLGIRTTIKTVAATSAARHTATSRTPDPVFRETLRSPTLDLRFAISLDSATAAARAVSDLRYRTRHRNFRNVCVERKGLRSPEAHAPKAMVPSNPEVDKPQQSDEGLQQ